MTYTGHCEERSDEAISTSRMGRLLRCDRNDMAAIFVPLCFILLEALKVQNRPGCSVDFRRGELFAVVFPVEAAIGQQLVVRAGFDDLAGRKDQNAVGVHDG